MLTNELKMEQSNLSGVLAENLFQILEQKQAIELFALQWLSEERQKPLNNITDFLYGDRTFTRVVLFTDAGRIFYRSSPRGQADNADEDIKSLLDEMSRDPGVRVILKEDGALQPPWQIPFLFPLKKGTEFKGAMLLELDIGYFLNLVQEINIGRTGRITLFSHRGAELVRFESGGLAIGGSWPRGRMAEAFEKASGSGTFSYPGSGDHYLTYRRINTYPLVITVSQGLDEFFREHRHNERQLFIILTVLTAICILAVWMLVKMINRNHQYLEALSASNRENKELIKKLALEHQASAKAASVDPLTELYNRRLFVSLSAKSLARARRNKLTYAILFIDLDRFKKINDSLGHHVGDLLLIEVARRLVDCTRDSDIVGRIGGDEFVVMLTDMSTEEDITPVVDKIMAAISAPYENLDGNRIITSPSIGIALYPRDGEDIDALLSNADAAMYKSKHSGRGRYSFFDASLNRVSVQSFRLEQRMPSAIAGGEFVLHYQPKIRLADYRVVGLESLVRWDHPEFQLIYPSDFIDIAEETGLITDLGIWILEAACRQVVRWKEQGLEPVPVAVNISPLELKDRGYAEKFLAVLAGYRLPPSCIEAEITENAFIHEKDVVVKNLSHLMSKGVKVSLDDFGKGFSNLDHIRSLPIHTLKIDRSFVQEIRNRHNDNPIVSSTIILAKKLNLTIVAEGVETHDQLINLKVAGCDEVQGYFFSRPVPEQEIRGFIRSPIRSV